MAASHPKAIPCILQNEGRKLFQMFQSIFTLTTHNTASLPSMRKQFNDIKQLEAESALAYTSRVDLLVANMAKLGEQVSSGMWIHVLGNGLRSEYKDTKDGILYSKDGYGSVILVKSKIQNEDAILKDSRAISKASQSPKVIHDEIAMKAAEIKSPKTKPPKEQVQFNKGKDGKKGGSKGQRQWSDTDQWANWKPIYWEATPSSSWASSNDQIGHPPPPKERVNSHLARHCGATSIRLMVTPQIGVLKILTNRVDHRNRNGAITIRLMVIPQKNVEKEMDDQHQHQSTRRVVKAKAKQLPDHGRAITSLLIMIRQHQ
jgi:hypothetical protein